MDSEIVCTDMTDITGVASFTSVVDNLTRSLGAYSGTSSLHGFASTVDNAMETVGADSGTYPACSFTSTVDNLTASLGADSSTSPVHGFASVVDNAIMSKSALNRGDYGFQLFSVAELVSATNNFSLENKIGAGSFGAVYRGKLVDGRKVAIKRCETGSKMEEFQEILHGYLLVFLRGLHHKHLLGIVGFCNVKDERILVYEYMKNGALYDHLGDKGNSVLNSWRMRIKIALDASRGIEYLHRHAVPSIIHGGIKSSNILLDATWTARVSNFGLLTKAARKVEYIDPENSDLNELTAKSDVYGLGVVLLELLTGKKAIFECGEDGGTPLSLVDFAVHAILAGELVRILDPRVGPTDVNEAEAVELVAYTAIHCVNLKGKDRLTMVDIVVNLERALAICNNSHDLALRHNSHDLAICDNNHDRALVIGDNSHDLAICDNNHDRVLVSCDNSHDLAISDCSPDTVLASCDNSHDSISRGTIPVVLVTKKKNKIFCCF